MRELQRFSSVQCRPLGVGSMLLGIARISIGGTNRYLRYIVAPQLLDWNACDAWQPVQLWKALGVLKQNLVRSEVDSVSEGPLAHSQSWKHPSRNFAYQYWGYISTSQVLTVSRVA